MIIGVERIIIIGVECGGKLLVIDVGIIEIQSDEELRDFLRLSQNNFGKSRLSFKGHTEIFWFWD